jgi:small subunit ribosomal protein S1
VDGLIHISKLSWDRVKHPSEVVEEGQRVKVKVEKLDPVTGKISLSYRDLVEQPWDKVQQSFVLNTVVPGTVSRITDFGAFVKLAPGIEGLVHISELANHRVSRVSSVVQVGQEVQVKILSVDSENQRMSLSMKQAAAPAQTEPTAEEPAAELSEQTVGLSVRSQDRQSLRGGTDRRTGGEKFGLKW